MLQLPVEVQPSFFKKKVGGQKPVKALCIKLAPIKTVNHIK